MWFEIRESLTHIIIIITSFNDFCRKKFVLKIFQIRKILNLKKFLPIRYAYVSTLGLAHCYYSYIHLFGHVPCAMKKML